MSGIEQCSRTAVRRQARRAASWGLVVVVAWLSGCATITKDSPVAEKQALAEQQSRARWDLVIKGEAGEAYDRYMSPGSRQVISRTDFIATVKRTAFRTANIEQVECASETCKVSVRITYDYQQKRGIQMKGVGVTVVENWVIEDGKLWYVWSP